VQHVRRRPQTAAVLLTLDADVVIFSRQKMAFHIVLFSVTSAKFVTLFVFIPLWQIRRRYMFQAQEQRKTSTDVAAYLHTSECTLQGPDILRFVIRLSKVYHKIDLR